MLFCPSVEGFWPLTASITSTVKNNYVHFWNERNFEQNQLQFFFCRMYSFAVIIKDIDKIVWPQKTKYQFATKNVERTLIWTSFGVGLSLATYWIVHYQMEEIKCSVKSISFYPSALDFCNSPVWNIEFDELNLFLSLNYLL